MPDNDSVTARPFTTFNFRVRIELGGEPLCSAAFSECSGLEMTMEPETRREGGNNVTEFQMVGTVSYGQLTLRRGMTETFHLWGWFDQVNRPQGYRTRAKAVQRSSIVAQNSCTFTPSNSQALRCSNSSAWRARELAPWLRSERRRSHSF